jgi:enoyl-CoA hydratase/carnithine racemase
MMADVGVSTIDGVQILRLTRPQKKNALTQDMYTALSDWLEAGDAAPDVAAHVLLGSAGVFCAGNDIKDFLAASSGAGGLGPATLRFINLLPVVKKPIVAGVDGAAVGVGTTLLLHCDLVYASPQSSFSTPFLDLGLVPEAASSLLMPRRIGYARAFEMLVLGNAMDAEHAREAGLINAVVLPDEVEVTAIGAARRLAAKPPGALAMSRRLLRGETAEILERTEEEATLFRACLQSPEAREAFQAFLEKRAPNFSKFRSKS